MGGIIRFWEDHWVGESPLIDKFVCLFSIASKQGIVVKELGEWRDRTRIWNLEWR